MDFFENSKDWKDEAKIDYFAPFIKLWVGFNSWYEKSFIKDKQKKEVGENLKNFDINILQLLIDNDFLEINGSQKVIIKKDRIITRNNFLEDTEFILKEKALEIWNILLEDRLGDKKFIEQISKNSDLEGVFMSKCANPEFKQNLFKLRSLSKELLNERKINIDDVNEREIYSFYWSISNEDAVNNSLFSQGIESDEAKKQQEIFDGKDFKKDTFYRLDLEGVEYCIFPEIYKNFLFFVYIVRNKIIHGEFSPKSERHEKLAKYTFFILKDFIQQFLK